MISTIEGKVIFIKPNELIINVHGMGFNLHVTDSIVEKSIVGNDLFLFTHLVVREDALTLYGFNNLEEKELFLMLLGVNGVGPRAALAILNSLSVDNIRKAVINEKPEIFSRVPGIGNKTAQKIILHLEGKIAGEPEMGDYITMDSDAMVLEALTGLGYSVVEAQAALQSIPKDTPDEISERIRAALNYFSQ